MSESELPQSTGIHAPLPSAAKGQNWSTPATPSSSTPARASARSTRTRSTRGGTLVPQPSILAVPLATPGPAPTPAGLAALSAQTQQPRTTLQPTRQAHVSSYAARMRTGASLLMQPLVAGVAAPAAGAGSTSAPAPAPPPAPEPRAAVVAPSRTTGRGRTQVNYTEPGSADEFEDDEPERGSDDSDFVASGGVRQSIRRTGASVAPNRAPGGRGGATAANAKAQTGEITQSYLGQIPPTRLVVPRPFKSTPHEYL
jgi:chromatin structure-remodeling complex subunit SFH1